MKIDDVIAELQRIRAMRGNVPLVRRVQVIGDVDEEIPADYEEVSVDDAMVTYSSAPSHRVPVVLVS